MKIVFVLHSHNAGGAERHLVDLMHGLRTSGHECIYAGPLDGWLGNRLLQAGFQCEDIPYHGIYDVFSLIRLMKLIRRVKADLVHGHLTRGALYAGWAAYLTSVPCVATAHSTNANKHFGKAKRIIAVSDAVRRFLVDSGYPHINLRTVHNGVPDYTSHVRLPREKIRELLKIDDGLVISMVARLEEVKGHDIALEALSKLKSRSWTLMLAGSTETAWAQKMQALANEMGVADKVRFIGHTDDVKSIYACTDILIAPSRREALSLTLLEAASFSLPVVAANVGGICEAVLDKETGFLIPSENSAELASAIEILLDNVDLRTKMGNKGRERYEKSFSCATMVQNTIIVYEELLAGR